MDENPQSQNQTSSAQPPTQQTSSNDNLPPKKSKLSLIIRVIIVAVVLAGIVVAIVFVTTMFQSPSKSDYTEANNRIIELANDYNNLELKRSKDESIHKTKEKVEKFKKDLEEISKMKAVANDKEVKKAYNLLVLKMSRFTKIFNLIFEIEGKITPALEAEAGLYNKDTGANYREKVRRLEEIMPSLEVDANKEYVKNMIKHCKKVAGAYDKQQQAYNNKDYSSPSDFYKILDEAEGIKSDWHSKLQGYEYKDLDIKAELDAFYSLVAKKANEENKTIDIKDDLEKERE